MTIRLCSSPSCSHMRVSGTGKQSKRCCEPRSSMVDYCEKRRKDGAFIVWRETAKKRMVAKLQEIKRELTRLRHAPIALVGEWLRTVTRGYYQYHAVPGNLHRLQLFRWRLQWVWWRALSRRGQRRRVPLAQLTRLMKRWIPIPRALHPYPMERFAATHPRREP